MVRNQHRQCIEFVCVRNSNFIFLYFPFRESRASFLIFNIIPLDNQLQCNQIKSSICDFIKTKNQSLVIHSNLTIVSMAQKYVYSIVIVCFISSELSAFVIVAMMIGMRVLFICFCVKRNDCRQSAYRHFPLSHDSRSFIGHSTSAEVEIDVTFNNYVNNICKVKYFLHIIIVLC